MIIEYQRPTTIPEALFLLARDNPISHALGGGTYLNRGMVGDYAVIDLQALGLGTISQQGNLMEVGAATSLQTLAEFEGTPREFRGVIEREASYNLRQMATIAGTLITSGGRSPFGVLMLALDAKLEIQRLNTSPDVVKIGDWYPLRGETKRGALITKISFPVQIKAAFESIARTPADLPIICAGVAQWPSGRTRLALGGWGEAPTLAMDGSEAGGAETAARSAYSQAGDEWASAEYRQEMAGILTLRCLRRITS